MGRWKLVVCFLGLLVYADTQALRQPIRAGGKQTSLGSVTPSNQVTAVKDLYNWLNGSNWKHSNNWMLGDPCQNHWYGIVCKQNSDGSYEVVEINLANNKLIGAIPESIGQLTSLTTLLLYRNNIKGTLPAVVGNLLNLVDLELNNCSLSGPIPYQYGQLKHLSFLFLNDNQLSGTLPSFLQTPWKSASGHFDISGNQFACPLPTWCGETGDQLCTPCTNDQPTNETYCCYYSNGSNNFCDEISQITCAVAECPPVLGPSKFQTNGFTLCQQVVTNTCQKCVVD